jgi:hypothetical protein
VAVRQEDSLIGDVVAQLKATERELERQLAGVRAAISALDGNAVSRRGRPAAAKPVRKRRALSAKARAAISRAQKLRWAKHRAANK